MLRANNLAKKGLGLTAPNPIVGAIIVDQNGVEISSGYHAGGDHAEIVALNNAKATGLHDFSNCTIVITLEPCNHQGKTPPCSQALIDAGFKNVVFAVSDPNKIASGGAERLRAANIQVISGIQEKYVAYTNRAWLHKVEKNHPWIVAKIAVTLDGKIAAQDGSSKWITSESARYDVAILRNQSDSIVTSTKTVLADDPQLTPRFPKDSKHQAKSINPVRVVMGNSAIPKSFKINENNAETVFLNSHDFSALVELGRNRGWNQIMVEAGSRFTTALMQADLIDELVIYMAPALLGAGQNFIENLGISTLSERKEFNFSEVSRVGSDLRISLLANGSKYSEVFDKGTIQERL
ncbi:MAG: hypothetical protein RLZZ159_382 [Actinomycetota bacterium]|jgi:diaminohydroxyphosphoribosylaminopyrimidine deaminase/5-amino-6-(5-phosphoribosylamino)uracil reductase